MRKAILTAVIVITAAGMACADPLLLRKASNELDKGELEFGISYFSYQNDVVKFVDDADNVVREDNNTSMEIPLYVNYGITDKVESYIYVPYFMDSSKSESGGQSTTSDESYMGDPSIQVKGNIADSCCKMGAGAGLTLPMGDEEHRGGLDISGLLAMRKEMAVLTLNGEVTYTLTGEYEESAIKTNPGDNIGIGVGIEHPVKPVEGLILIGELLYNSFGEAKIDGEAMSDTSGSKTDAVIGMEFSRGRICTNLGLALSLGSEKYREYDYKVLAGITYYIKL